MPYSKLLIHALWSTKKREPYITKEFRPKLLIHINENAAKKNIYIDTVNCVKDHIHILINLKPDQKLSDAIQLIKGESSYWINKNNLINYKFEWQDEYFAVSVSESQADKVRNYIKNQEEHHKIKTFMDEYKEFIRKIGFDEHNSG